MGGEGSGRKPDMTKRVLEQFTPKSASAMPLGEQGGLPIILPDYSGVAADKKTLAFNDTRYVNIAGDTMTGDLLMDVASKVIFRDQFNYLNSPSAGVFEMQADSTMYLGTAGTRLLKLTSAGLVSNTDGSMNLGGASNQFNSLYLDNQIISSLATGTAPFSIASTTKVTNLNADLLDGASTGTSGTAIPLLDGTNTWSGVQTYSDGKLALRNPANTKSVTIKAGAQTSDITWTFPVGSNDTFVGTSTAPTTGTYTPTITSSTNTDTAVTATTANYTKIGGDTSGLVIVSGRFTADPTLAATATSFEMSLPVASSFASVYDAAGTATCGNIASMSAEVIGVPRDPGATAKIQWKSTDITSQTWSYIFQYRLAPSNG